MNRLIITNSATGDMNKAKRWYNKQQSGLGFKFVDYIFDCFEQIRKHPLGYASKYAYTREMVVKKYPYLIIYSIEENVLFILRVFPCRTNPKKKYARKRK
jgi:plasmid stabilization system protein ParE